MTENATEGSESPPSTYPIDSDPSNWSSCKISSLEHENSVTWGKLIPMSAVAKTDVVELEKDIYTFGRLSTCDVVFSKNMSEEHLKVISKVHFKITRLQVTSVFVVYLEDLSCNGTFVNDQKIGKGNKRPLNNNDVISLAKPYIKVFVYTDCLKERHENYPKAIDNKYIITKELGAGSCGEVRLAFEKTTWRMFAMKIIQKSTYCNGGMNDPTKISNEIKILKRLSHPCIIHIEDFVDTTERCFMVLALAEGGDLMKYVMQSQYLSEKEAKQIFYQVVLAVQYLHSKGITHRDLKPQNILLASEGPNTLIKITDFGLSKIWGRLQFGSDVSHSASCQNSEKFRSDIMQTVCGSPLYVAPEILSRSCSDVCGVSSTGYTHMVDIWSMGVVLYVCLSGCPPFLTPSSSEGQEASETDYGSETSTRSVGKRQTLHSAILSGDYCFPQKLWKHVTGTAVDLIKKMLTVDPHHRITTEKILEHVWLQDDKMKSHVCRLMSPDSGGQLHECHGNDDSSSHSKENVRRCLKRNRSHMDD